MVCFCLAEGEERLLIERRSYEDPKLRHLIQLLIDWMNDELADQRIIVKSIEDDLYDGQILQKLLGIDKTSLKIKSIFYQSGIQEN